MLSPTSCWWINIGGHWMRSKGMPGLLLSCFACPWSGRIAADVAPGDLRRRHAIESAPIDRHRPGPGLPPVEPISLFGKSWSRSLQTPRDVLAVQPTAVITKPSAMATIATTAIIRRNREPQLDQSHRLYPPR